MAKRINQLLAESNIAFGTSGARGLVSDFSNEVCAAFTQSFVRSMQQRYNFNKVAIGIDNRPSSPQMAAACIGILKAMGLEVDYYGVLPTPALAYQSMQDNVPAIMVTGSHIPFDRNGLKFYRPDGEISKIDEQAILNTNEPLLNSTAELPEVNQQANEHYVQRYLTIFASDLLQGQHIGIYEHSSAGRDLYYRVFEGLGAQVTRLERSNSFVPIDTEAVSDSDKLKAESWAMDYHFDAIFTTDGDGDRPLIADEKGHWIRGDIVGLLTAKALGVSAVAVPVSCNTAIEQSGFFQKVVRTKIGSPYVIAAFSEISDQASYAGFEANGGFLLGSDITYAHKQLKALPTRDALLPALAILALADKRPISELITALPKRFTASDRLQNVPVAWSKRFIATATENPAELIKELGFSPTIEAIDTTDGLRIKLQSGDIVHLRPSGNAPELRCYVDSDSTDNADTLLGKVLSQLSRKF
jgi:phosphomannomutase